MPARPFSVRRFVIAAGAAAALVALAGPAAAQGAWPNKPVKIIVPVPPGGTTDILAPGRGAFSPPNDPRAFGEVLGQFLKHPEAWRHLNDEAPIYAQEWTDVAMAERLARLYGELTNCKIGQKFRLTVAI